MQSGSQKTPRKKSPPARTSQEIFAQVRRDHAMETAEDYVEAVAKIVAQQGTCRGADLARHFDVSHVTVSKILTRLKAEGLLRARPYGPVELTDTGTRLASMSQQRHETVLHFLLAIGVDKETARIDAEGIEHHVSQATLKRFLAFLGQQPPPTSSR
ncbi:MAG: manganese-binding transcriptional regulator MntR [Planctomycetota bacterium]|nr:manganese-binding transcriptional regulator MntR [Planctomycetota bacterium]MDA1180677.1 manganese-binding transcriptional regulator MntR [Planctomycetota bacterium]